MRAIHINVRSVNMRTVDMRTINVQIGTRGSDLSLSISNGTANDSESVEEGESEKGQSDKSGNEPATLAAEEVITVLGG